MTRDFRFDIARAVCMCYIIAALHLSQYLGQEYYIYETHIGRIVTFSCLGLFTFMSGYLIGKKNDFTPFTQSGNSVTHKVLAFYRKRFIRVYPLFFLATILLYVIGFNDLQSSALGLIGLAPFITHQPKTLWYISMLIVFYLITPLVNRNSIKWKITTSLCFIIIFSIAKLFIYVDSRFIFNLFFYCLGLVMSGIECNYINTTNNLNVKMHLGIILMYIALMLLTNYYLPNSVAILSIGAIGVLGIFSLTCILAKIKNQGFVRTIGHISYASMVCYMFHRFYYWAGLSLYNPENIVKKTIFLVLVFVIGLVISYFVQKGYDKMSLSSHHKTTL